MGTCKAPIFNLFSSSLFSSRSKLREHPKPISRPPLTNRRLLLFSLPVSTLLLNNSLQPSSCCALESFDPVSPTDRKASLATSQRISEALGLLDKGRELQAQGDFDQALYCFSQSVCDLEVKSVLKFLSLFQFHLCPGQIGKCTITSHWMTTSLYKQESLSRHREYNSGWLYEAAYTVPVKMLALSMPNIKGFFNVLGVSCQPEDRMSAVLGAIFNCYKTNNTSTSMIPFFLCGRISVWGIVVEQAPHGLPLSKSLCCSLAITDSPSNPHLLDCCLILCAPSSYHVPLSGLLYLRAVIEKYKDFAFSEYARVGRALALYEVGDKEEAIAELEDVSISLKGYPEVHAALAAALYEDKHAPLLAENQFTIAVLLDPHYSDLSYVKETKHWPPSLIISLRNFITLS
ncbi:hypothetical protein FEM48_Zijuj08G0194200 [Ziziphus jujuba var. spinosa]|uniref:Uncharacterized protein n=1 Tax=Ziziphus jujuba var. spinosa TaxID=714518 RepID=A0A978V0X8_ZIZJJ|nr:hypothetical protein FEM48_Zijuj08G0194200 [Ziziphus jujuba var. spinosa]